MKERAVYKSEEGRRILMAFYDEMIAKWAFPYESITVDTRFGETHLAGAGGPDRPALVLLHGSSSNILGWGAAIPEYMREFRVIAPDIPGDPGRSAPVRPSWANDDYILWLDDLLDGLGIGSAALLGLSMGGWIASKYAAARPARMSRLALLAPGGITPARSSAVWKTVLYSLQGRRGAEKLKRLVFGGGPVLPEVSRFFDLLQEHYAPRFGSPPLLTDAELRSVTCPVFVHAGGEDAFFDAEKAAGRIRSLLPGAQVHIGEGGRHGVTSYGGEIHAFLAGQTDGIIDQRP